MKPLSESLTDLANRVKKLEDSAAAMQENNRAVLQVRREQLESDFDHEVAELEKTAAELRGAAHNWWSQSKDAIERQIAAMRADFENWQTEMKQKSADRAAQNAEDAAAVAISLAAYCLDAAEWAVVRAGLARGEAEQPATKG